MIDGLQPYPTYRNAGVDVVGLIPEHWQAVRLGTVGTFLKGSGGSKDDEAPDGVPCIRYGDLYTQHEFFIRRTRSFVTAERAAAYTPVERGDVLFAGSGETFEDIGKSAVVLMESPVVAGGDVLILRPRGEFVPEYLGLIAGSAQAVNQKASMGVGVTVKHVYPSDLKHLWIPVPSLEEQPAIVRYIDRADRLIRRYVSAKQKLIKLLEEQRRAVVREAVTKGVDTNVARKPSGVEWLGEVPEHWQTWPLGRLARIGNGSTPSRGNTSFWQNGRYPWLNSASVNRSPILESDQYVTDVALRDCHLPRVPPGSVLVAITGQGKTRGTSAILGIEATINQHIAYITPRRGIVTTEFLHQSLVAAYQDLRLLSDGSGSTKGALTCGDLAHFRIAVPPPAEQVHIVSSLHAATANLITALDEAHQAISLLRELRTRLIQDVVTGRLDVREATAGLPPETEDDGSSADEGDIEDNTRPDEVAHVSHGEWAT